MKLTRSVREREAQMILKLEIRVELKVTCANTSK